MASRRGEKARARERLAAERAAKQRRDRRRRYVLVAASGVAVVLVGVLVAWGVTARETGDRDRRGLPEPMSTVGTGKPPWPLPADSIAGARAAGLDITTMEGTAKHFHAHLAILVDGESVPVPGNIGVGPTGMSELHTHDAGGLLHVEAPTADKRYILGQLFRTWQVRLDGRNLGALRATGDTTLRAYVDGNRVKGDPAAIELKSLQQIILVYGPADAEVDLPTYTFTEEQ